MPQFSLYRDESRRKDWAFSAQPDFLRIRTGDTGCPLILTEIPHTKCSKMDPKWEMRYRIVDLTGDSSLKVFYVGEVELDSNGSLSSYLDEYLARTVYWSIQCEVNEKVRLVETMHRCATELNDYFHDVIVSCSEREVRINSYSIDLRGSGSNSIDFDIGAGTGLLTIDDGYYPLLWLQYVSSRLNGLMQLTSSSSSDVKSNYLCPIGYFSGRDVGRFTEFARLHGFLSVEAKIMARMSLPNVNDWL